jgi:hypothetical protein
MRQVEKPLQEQSLYQRDPSVPSPRIRGNQSIPMTVYKYGQFRSLNLFQYQRQVSGFTLLPEVFDTFCLIKKYPKNRGCEFAVGGRCRSAAQVQWSIRIATIFCGSGRYELVLSQIRRLPESAGKFKAVKNH